MLSLPSPNRGGAAPISPPTRAQGAGLTVGGPHTVNVNSGADRERRAMLRLQVDHRGAVENRGARAGILRRMMVRVRESGDCEFPQLPRPVENKSQRDGMFAIQPILVFADIATINDAAGGVVPPPAEKPHPSRAAVRPSCQTRARLLLRHR